MPWRVSRAGLYAFDVGLCRAPAAPRGRAGPGACQARRGCVMRAMELGLALTTLVFFSSPDYAWILAGCSSLFSCCWPRPLHGVARALQKTHARPSTRRRDDRPRAHGAGLECSAGRVAATSTSPTRARRGGPSPRHGSRAPAPASRSPSRYSARLNTLPYWQARGPKALD